MGVLGASRRRRFIIYSVAFAAMLAMSSVLDVRRASLKHRQSKVQLSLPSASSLSSLSNVDDSDDPSPAPVSAADVHVHPGPGPRDPTITLRPGAAPVPEVVPKKHGPSAPTLSSTQKAPVDGEQPPPKGDPVLSEQELKDDVDQLIAHVAEEEQGSANATAPAPDAPAPSEPVAKPPSEDRKELPVPVPDPVQKIANTFLGLGGESAGSTPDADAASKTANGTQVAADGTEVRLNSDESFSSAQKRLQTLLADEQVKGFVDENDLRALEALALQATRGDCEQKSSAEGGSLFKTDAEAASNVDIEKTDPLWGAWCLFMGSYKTDAMRDYVTKQRVVEEKVLAEKSAVEANSTKPATATATAFDPNAASLDDVMTPEQKSGLKEKVDTITSHLRENDVRYLAALSLQATFGDCGSYGKEVEVASKEPEQTVELRKLVEPLLDQRVVRREGAQWGAWCVLQGKKRTSAATELSQRVDLLINQLSMSQAAIHAGALAGDIPQSYSTAVKTVKSPAGRQEHVTP